MELEELFFCFPPCLLLSFNLGITMSGGTPVAGGYMRQRHSQGYASSGDDIEDDACSRFQTMSFHTPKSRTWIEVVENVLWLASAAFIVYYGDSKNIHNVFFLTYHKKKNQV